jgi:hypothetical protein
LPVPQEKFLHYTRDAHGRAANEDTGVHISHQTTATFAMYPVDKMRITQVDGWKLKNTTGLSLNRYGPAGQEWPEGRVYDYAMLRADFQHHFVTPDDYHSQGAAVHQCRAFPSARLGTVSENFPFTYCAAEGTKGLFACCTEALATRRSTAVMPECGVPKSRSTALEYGSDMGLKVCIVCGASCRRELDAHLI